MNATIVDGKTLAGKALVGIERNVKALRSQGIVPRLATILVGRNQASMRYLKQKHENCKKVGIASDKYELGEDSTKAGLETLIDQLNKDREVHGILLQLPLPAGLDKFDLIEKISPGKDVDGLHPENFGRLAYSKQDLIPCTPKGIMAILEYYGIRLTGKHAVIINRSNLIGKPLLHLMLQADATVTVCHSKTPNLNVITRQGDILVSAVGRYPEFKISGEMVKKRAIVLDVAISNFEGKLHGDIEFEEVAKKASYITPVPGGVGPMTVAMLLHNTVIAASKITGIGYSKEVGDIWAA